MLIGIVGGTFNPIHIGHLILAEEVREKKKLDKIIFIPTYLPPHKDNHDIIEAFHRLAMVRLAIKGNPYFEVSDLEVKRQGRSYTIDTLRQLRSQYRKDNLFFIIGSDLFNYLDEWKDLKQITEIAKFIVATRPGYPLEKISQKLGSLRKRVSVVAIRAVDVSAFEIRNRIQKGSSFRYLVPGPVYDYIVEKNLYKK
ncbi:MAG: nicotinate-nucleotide adenylyltransferase [Candidatus Omnitrophica bacterium]|nr:nicotinate-nucleotide adenylyltransferase [Candidatus Omnitrophota bacterium]